MLWRIIMVISSGKRRRLVAFTVTWYIVIHVLHCPPFTLPPSPSNFFSYSSSAVNGQLTVTPLPDILFQNNSGVHNIVEQSVIWLYCTADSTTAAITWTKDGVTLVNDPAHIRIRSSSSGMSTTSSLVVDSFQSSDNGNYVCQARDRMMTVNSSTLSLTGGCGCEWTVVITDALFLTNMWSGSLFVAGQVYALCLLQWYKCKMSWAYMYT